MYIYIHIYICIDTGGDLGNEIKRNKGGGGDKSTALCERLLRETQLEVYIYIYIYIRICTCVYTFILFMYACIYEYIYLYIYTCIEMHIFTTA
jgi:hypothetical protein